MLSPNSYAHLADGVLALHVLYVLFVVLGLVVILVGGWRGWRWVRNPWFRRLHLLAIAVVVLQVWVGLECPLTTLELALRSRAGTGVYDTSFIGHWLRVLLYYQAPAWVFGVVYTLFGLLVTASWLWVRPRSIRGNATQGRNVEDCRHPQR